MEGTNLSPRYKPYEVSPASSPVNRSNSRILHDVPCKACGDNSSGKHYGIYACDGCAGFFKRTIRKIKCDPNFSYTCGLKRGVKDECLTSKERRNECKSCRFKKCLEVGMMKDSVQDERGARKPKLQAPLNLALPQHSPVAQAIYFNSGPRPLLSDMLYNHFMPTVYSCNGFARPMLFRENTIQQDIDICFTTGLEWSSNLPEFRYLPYKDRTILMRQNWHKIFILNLGVFIATYAPRTDFRSYMQALQQYPILDFRQVSFLEKMEKIQEVLASICLHRVYGLEFVYLQLLCLFKVKETSLDELSNAETIERIYCQHKADFHSLFATFPTGLPVHIRRNQLESILDEVHSLDPYAVESVFFKHKKPSVMHSLENFWKAAS